MNDTPSGRRGAGHGARARAGVSSSRRGAPTTTTARVTDRWNEFPARTGTQRD
eukprot:COSAG02_NODE_37844_length_437_cov_37.753709_1_plen_52_part_10